MRVRWLSCLCVLCASTRCTFVRFPSYKCHYALSSSHEYSRRAFTVAKAEPDSHHELRNSTTQEPDLQQSRTVFYMLNRDLSYSRSHENHEQIVQRDLTSTIKVVGFHLLFQSIDIVVSSSLTTEHTNELYRNITFQLSHGQWRQRLRVKYLVIIYGAMKLTFSALSPQITAELVHDFAYTMAEMGRTVTIVTFDLVAISTGAVIWISMQLAAGANPESHLLTG